MDESRWTPKAVILAAVLHLGIVAFLFLAILPCSSYESFVQAIGLPTWMNPISCKKPIQLAGQVIDATLVGVTSSPPPKAAKAKPIPNTQPPPPSVPPPTPPVQQPKQNMPPPPKNPDVKDQERVVEEAAEKAEQAKQLQEEKERQRQSELDAQAAKKKEQQQKIDELLAKMDAASSQTKAATSKAQQAKQQMEDLKDAQDNARSDLPKADQLQSGQNGPDAGLKAQYLAAIQNTLKENWVGQANIAAGQRCLLHIIQLPGGDVMSASVDSSCPYDAAGRKSVEDAARRAGQLPYKGFESVFTHNVDMYFTP